MASQERQRLEYQTTLIEDPMRTRSIILMAFVILCFTLGASAADWPQWRGPQRDGTCPSGLDVCVSVGK